jgi:predicted amidohydrolase YtcJ
LHHRVRHDSNIYVKKLLYLLLSVFFLAACISHEAAFVRSLNAPRLADWIILNGRVITLDKDSSIKEAVAVKDGLIIAVGSDGEMRRWRGRHTREINAGRRTIIPGLIDSRIHATVAGMSWDSDLHWEKFHSLAQGLSQIAAAAEENPAGTWIVVAGGWTPAQFSEGRLPTRAELDLAAPRHPVYIQILDQAALVNSAALKALRITRETRDPPGGRFERNAKTDELTGLALGSGAWRYVYDKVPRPTLDKMRGSLRNCFRELNRLGLTSVGDLHTDKVNFSHRRLLNDMARAGELTLRMNFYVTPNEPGDELEQFRRAVEEIKQLKQSDLFRFAGFADVLGHTVNNGAVAPDTEGITLNPAAKNTLHRAVQFFAADGYNFQLHATHDKIARQLLDVIEPVNRDTPLSQSRIGFAHLEDATPATLGRIKNLGAGIAVQSRLALIGETLLRNKERIHTAPPLRTMLDSNIPLGAGTDGFRSSNHSPMLALRWLITGTTIAGTPMRDPKQNLTRIEALRVYTLGSAWFTGDEKRKGSIEPGKFADLAVLSADYLGVPEERIPDLESVLTMVGGRVVYAAGPFARFEKPQLQSVE